MTDAKSDDSYARDLLIHAECLIRYLRISGGSSAELQATYSALKAADPTAADRSRLLIDLETKVVELQQTILPETRAAISGGWPRANTRWNRTKDKFVSGLLIVLAMVLVLATGKLTYIQNTGNNLIGELESLSSPDTLKTYSRLIRGMAQAWYQADKALPPAETDQKTANAESDLRQVGAYWGAVSVPPAGGDPVPATVTPDDAAAKTAAAFDTYTLPAQFDLARNVYFDNEADLKSIVDRYSAAMEGQRTIYGQFNTTCVPAAPDAQSESYVNGVKTGESQAEGGAGGGGLLSYFSSCPNAPCILFSLLLPLSIPDMCVYGNRNAARTDVTKDSVPVQFKINPALKDFSGCMEANLGTGWKSDFDKLGALPESFELYESNLQTLTSFLLCRDVIPVGANLSRSPTDQLARLKATILPLSLILLPALYGATGGALSLMRSRFDATRPNPSLSVGLFRIAFGAVIGVILVWFVTPDSAIQSQMATVGLSLLGFAFILGFAQNRIFEFFDQLSVNVFKEPEPPKANPART